MHRLPGKRILEVFHPIPSMCAKAKSKHTLLGKQIYYYSQKDRLTLFTEKAVNRYGGDIYWYAALIRDENIFFLSTAVFGVYSWSKWKGDLTENKMKLYNECYKAIGGVQIDFGDSVQFNIPNMFCGHLTTSEDNEVHFNALYPSKGMKKQIDRVFWKMLGLNDRNENAYGVPHRASNRPR